ncbi:hypothetical protein [Streptomyces cremeus]|uniref:Uncharacterized protein n=1 Tax=Streptomyces cremeus TaxID=66881 RepID=A0ABV5P603_STRCM
MVGFPSSYGIVAERRVVLPSRSAHQASGAAPQLARFRREVT